MNPEDTNPFDQGLLNPILLRGLGQMGIKTPTPIQQQSLPATLAGRDVVGIAPTGTGKTLAYVIPLAEQLLAAPPPVRPGRGVDPRHRLRALVLCPVRELAQQVAEEGRALLKGSVLRSQAVYGKSALRPQRDMIADGVDLLVGTPGRLRELINCGAMSLAHVRHVVVDEGDRMLDMGFLPQVRYLLARVPAERQMMFFSATMPPPISQLASDFLETPYRVDIGANTVVKHVGQHSIHISEILKVPMLLALVKGESREGVIIYARARRRAGWVATALRRHGLSVGLVHGNRSQAQRQLAIKRFAEGELPVLVATDVASRGIDVDNITHVINVDLPNDAETYTHRIGRTGRAGADGTAITFCAREDVREFRKMEHDVEAKIKRMKDEKDLLFIEPENPGKPGKKKPGKGRGSRNTAPPAWSKFNRSSRSEGQSNRKSSSGKKSDPRMGRKKYDNASPEEQDSSSRRERRHEEGSGRKPWQGKPRSEGRKAPQGKPRTEGRKAPHDKTGPATDKPRKKHKTTDPAKKAKHSTEKVGTEERSADQKPRSGKKRFQPAAPKKKKAKRLGRREREAAKAKKRGKKSKRPSVN